MHSKNSITSLSTLPPQNQNLLNCLQIKFMLNLVKKNRESQKVFVVMYNFFYSHLHKLVKHFDWFFCLLLMYAKMGLRTWNFFLPTNSNSVRFIWRKALLHRCSCISYNRCWFLITNHHHRKLYFEKNYDCIIIFLSVLGNFVKKFWCFPNDVLLKKEKKYFILS